MQLLTGQLPGFMHGTHAMPDAITHLIAHDAGVMAGMRASLSNMLLSLDPRNADAALQSSLARRWITISDHNLKVKPSAKEYHHA